jgi:tRNA pseudouridine55 synthase
VLVVDKPQGPTSHDVVAVARRTLGVSRIGHTGTLDPMATGVLPLVVGRATRLAQFLSATDKEYEAAVAFGRSTDTYDATGAIVGTSDQRPDQAQVEAALAPFRGTFEQVPPAHSAKRIGGERSYDLARKSKGPPTLPKAVTVHVRELELLGFDGETARLRVRATAGFYVRSLAHDIGAALGMGAVLSGLRRTRAGQFGLTSAVCLAEIIQGGPDAAAAHMVPFDTLLPEMPAVSLRDPSRVERVRNGVEVAPADVQSPAPAGAELVRLLGPDGALVGLARPGRVPGYLQPSVVFA